MVDRFTHQYNSHINSPNTQETTLFDDWDLDETALETINGLETTYLSTQNNDLNNAIFNEHIMMNDTAISNDTPTKSTSTTPLHSVQHLNIHDHHPTNSIYPNILQNITHTDNKNINSNFDVCFIQNDLKLVKLIVRE